MPLFAQTTELLHIWWVTTSICCIEVPPPLCRYSWRASSEMFSHYMFLLLTQYHSVLTFFLIMQVLRIILWIRVGWPCLSIHWPSHRCIFFYKAILEKLFSYLSYLSSFCNYCFRSQGVYMLSIPDGQAEMRKKVYTFSAPAIWNILQKASKPGKVKCLINSIVNDSIGKLSVFLL